ncbi:TetR/AcrR family transcriptional regulator [Actinoallomurus sp. CA-150999]|uniref:TetR/AcrR family transcriptional regulator n=1 Tax=Actinoallomurus sp. CA-150999 TaxID=3239887 RepID=UPI003D92CCCE
MPKLWEESIEAHRHQVRDAILDATAALVAEQGPSVTMSQIAERAGIGRATLYKYFGDIGAILHAWHARQITRHLRELAEIRDRTSGPTRRLAAVLEAYALITHRTRRHDDIELVTFLHRGEQVTEAERHLHEMVRELITDAVQAGEVRRDVAPDELAGYCLHALGAAVALPSEDAVRRLVQVTMAGLQTA